MLPSARRPRSQSCSSLNSLFMVPDWFETEKKKLSGISFLVPQDLNFRISFLTTPLKPDTLTPLAPGVSVPIGNDEIRLRAQSLHPNSALDGFGDSADSSRDRMYLVEQKSSQNETFQATPASPGSLYSNRRETGDPESEKPNKNAKSASGITRGSPCL